MLMEIRAMLARRASNPFGVFVEGLATGGFIILIEKVMGNSDVQTVASRQVMFIASVLALPALQGLHRLIAEETAYGTMETLLQVPYGPLRVFLCRDISSLASVCLILPFTVAVIASFSRVDLVYYARYAIPVILMRSGLVGMGMILGSATLLFRRTGAIVNLTSIIMVTTSLGAGLGKGLLNTIALLSPHGYLAAGILKGAEPLTVIPALGLISFAWIAAGLGVYNLAVERARRLGLLINP